MSAIQNGYQSLTVANGATGYLEVPSGSSVITSIHIWWDDATSSATITLETSNRPGGGVAYDSTTAGHWCTESGVSITGPAGSAAGGTMVHLGNMGSMRTRLKVVAAANTTIYVAPHGKH